MPRLELVLQTSMLSHGVDLDLLESPVLTEASSGSGKTAAALAVAELMLQRGGRCNRLQILMPRCGKASGLYQWLTAFQDVQRQARGFQEDLAELDHVVDLLRTAERDNSLPAITSSLILGGRDLGVIHQRLGLEASDLAKVIETLLRVLERPVFRLLRALEVFFGIWHFYTAASSPRHAMSPCGVIRFAAPLVPRAPGHLFVRRTTSVIGVLTA